MKVFIPLAVAASVLLFTACKKEEEKRSEPGTITVVEAVANAPIAGASVNIQTCRAWGILGRCEEIYPTLPVTTNNEGIANLSGIKDVYIVTVSKEKYWEGYEPFSRSVQPANDTVPLHPVATLKINLIKQNQHPADAKMLVASPFNACYNCGNEQILLEQLKDTTIYMKGKGNIPNHVQWSVLDAQGNGSSFSNSPEVLVNHFDTAAIEIRY